MRPGLGRLRGRAAVHRRRVRQDAFGGQPVHDLPKRDLERGVSPSTTCLARSTTADHRIRSGPIPVPAPLRSRPVSHPPAGSPAGSRCPRGAKADAVEWPLDAAPARPVTQPPAGPSWAYETKGDGHRTVLWRTDDSVRLQSRTGRDVTALWMVLAVTAMRLTPGVILAWALPDQPFSQLSLRCRAVHRCCRTRQPVVGPRSPRGQSILPNSPCKTAIYRAAAFSRCLPASTRRGRSVVGPLGQESRSRESVSVTTITDGVTSMHVRLCRKGCTQTGALRHIPWPSASHTGDNRPHDRVLRWLVHLP